MRKNIILRDPQTINDFEEFIDDAGTASKAIKYLIKNYRLVVIENQRLKRENEKLTKINSLK